MSLNISLDWLTATSPIAYDPDEILAALEWQRQSAGLMHYQQSWRDSATGARFCNTKDYEPKGSCVILGGQAIQIMNESFQRTADAIVRNLASVGFSATRMDFALDILNCDVRVEQAYSDYKSGLLKVPATTFRFVEGGTHGHIGHTLYFGSRESERFMRVYDKGIETGYLPAGQWLRVEIEMKGKRAKQAWEQSVQFGTVEWGASEIASYLRWENAFYMAALEGRTSPPPVIGERPLTNRRKWLLGQVLSAFAKEQAEDPKFTETFLAALEWHDRI